MDANIIERCKAVCPAFHEDTACAFAEGNIIATLDTSQTQDGSRGIAFYEDGISVNFDGETRWIRYDGIKSAQIISSFEDSFADELLLSGEGFEVRVSDYSLDKSELKSLLSELTESSKAPVESAPEIPAEVVEAKKRQTEEYAEIIAQKLAESALVNHGISETYSDDIVFEDGEPVISEIEIPHEKALPEGYDPAPIPDEGINWLSEKPAKNPPEEDSEESESEAREKIQNMSREETLSYLAQSLSEINDMDFGDSDDDVDAIEEIPESTVTLEETKHISEFINSAPISETLSESKPSTDSVGLTIEPIWGDIYIKASRNLREVIESGKLTMEQIEKELKDKLLDSTRAFAEITADESKIPKSLVARIHELKTAADDFEQYFKSGEDIAVRAMFFMMYQMLSYSDRIAETPETKARLNDFFRRFGPAGITLSMLDMRV
ncbi:MAG: hypothetical protein K2N06_00410 [Oscillospiraceae bacterium]|nr:hypothetical protein [Oscillospiraceae bacterium]